MNKSQLEKILKEYKIKKSLVEVTNSRIEAYNTAILNPDIIASWRYNSNDRELGMPSAHNMSSTVESELCANELTIQTIKDWIKEEKARIFRTSLEIKQIEISLQGLTKQENYIISMKYFERCNWKSIEIGVNQQFRQQNCITESGLKKINEQALDKLVSILTPYYDYTIAKN